MQAPSIGRRVWVYPNGAETHDLDMDDDGFTVLSDQPFDCGIVHVNSDGTINVAGFDHECGLVGFDSIQLYDSDQVPEVRVNDGEAYATWMPYQKAQREKTAVGGGMTKALNEPD